MKISELWLREWIQHDLTKEQLCKTLTMAGLEVDKVSCVASKFTNVVVGEILSITPHPAADKLNICEVDVGAKEPIAIVCGASNVKQGMKVPTALEGAILPNNFKIKKTKLRGVASLGMLCSAKELDLAEESEGLMELPQSAVVGADIWEYLLLDDYVLDISITPNRGDCLSIMGLAKEVSALTQSAMRLPNFHSMTPSNKDTLSLEVHAKAECPRYLGRLIRNINPAAETPIWMQERLRRSGQRCIHPVVDVMNYIMLELGQPMHAFDANKISSEISVRLAAPDESLALLDGQTVTLNPQTLIIADTYNPLAIAGVMGGIDSAVTHTTKDIFLESAFFNPETVSRAVRHYLLNSESSYRFERGVDPINQRRAIEHATDLLIRIVGGEVGPVTEICQNDFIPKAPKISLQKLKIKKLIGIDIPDSEIMCILTRLDFEIETTLSGWEVVPPLSRSDIKISEDVIEEIVRLYGYDKVPTHLPLAVLQMPSQLENIVSLSMLRNRMQSLGFNEVITYSFVSQDMQALLNPGFEAKQLLNPMTSDMAVMRTNLWPGLINSYLYNQNRHQSRVRFFEIGMRFIQEGEFRQEQMLSGLISGSAFPEQWGVASKKVDFFDLKGDIESLLSLTNALDEFEFTPTHHKCLHPGQSADLYRNGKIVGLLGALHPSILKNLGLHGPIFVFELSLNEIIQASIPKPSDISKFPEIRRDLAILVERTVPSQRIQDTIKNVAGDLLKEIKVFDLYQGKEIASTHKSIALALTLQHNSRTLVEKEVAEVIERVVFALKEQFTAELRG